MYKALALALALAFALLSPLEAAHSQIVIGISGSYFTLNGAPTYTAPGGFPRADPRVKGTLLNVRAVQAIFDDSHYPQRGSAVHPYKSSLVGPVVFDYPDGPFSADRNLREFLAALPAWRRAGVLAFTVNLQGGGPSDGNFGGHDQPQLNSGFDSHGNLKPAYAARLREVIEKADQLGMVVIVGYFYQGCEHWIDQAPHDAYVREAIRQASLFLRMLPNRNILVEIANEVSATMYHDAILQPDGVIDAVSLAQDTVQHQIPVSFSWIGPPPPPGSSADKALRTVDYLLIHTNGKNAKGVQDYIQAMRNAEGSGRPLLINEDSVSTFNLEAAIGQHVGWGYYDQGINNYQDGFQSPPVNWTIDTDAKWIFFEQVARLSGSPVPDRTPIHDPNSPVISLVGISAGRVIARHAQVQVVVTGGNPHWPIKRVEFFVDARPYSYAENSPYLLNVSGDQDTEPLPAGRHLLRVVVYNKVGPKYSEICSTRVVPIVVDQ